MRGREERQRMSECQGKKCGRKINDKWQRGRAAGRERVSRRESRARADVGQLLDSQDNSGDFTTETRENPNE